MCEVHRARAQPWRSDVFVGSGNLLTNSVHLPRLRNDQQATSYGLVAMLS